MAITRVEPLLGDPDTMTHLPDPLSLYRPPSLDEGEKNDQSVYCSEEPQTKIAIVESCCKDDLPSECLTFSTRNRVNSDISAKEKRVLFKQKKIHPVSLCDIYSELIHLEWMIIQLALWPLKVYRMNSRRTKSFL